MEDIETAYEELKRSDGLLCIGNKHTDKRAIERINDYHKYGI